MNLHRCVPSTHLWRFSMHQWNLVCMNIVYTCMEMNQEHLFYLCHIIKMNCHSCALSLHRCVPPCVISTHLWKFSVHLWKLSMHERCMEMNKEHLFCLCPIIKMNRHSRVIENASMEVQHTTMAVHFYDVTYM